MARSRSDAGSELYRAIYKVVRRIPRGRVATYGQVAALAGLGGQPRLVGYALHAIEPALEPRAATIPWYRVINAQGRVSFRAEAGCGHEQRERLEREGVTFDCRDRVALDRYRWKPRT